MRLHASGRWCWPSRGTAAVDEPRFEDIYEVGVLAQLLELEPLTDGTLKVLAQAHRRVMIRRFFEETRRVPGRGR